MSDEESAILIIETLRNALARTEAMWRESQAKVRELEMRLLDIKRIAEK